MNEYDYSIHYSYWHKINEEEKIRMQKMYEAYLIHQYLYAINKKNRMLDIGCGMGFFVNALVKNGFTNVIGVDIDLQQTEIAKELGLSEYVFHIKNIFDYLSNEKVDFDIVFMLDVLEHIEPTQQIDLLKLIFNKLNKGGKIFIQVPNANSFGGGRFRYIDYTHKTTFTEHSLNFVLKNAYFRKIDIIDYMYKRYKFPKKFWKKTNRTQLKYWAVDYFWELTLKRYFGESEAEIIPKGLNILAIAEKPL